MSISLNLVHAQEHHQDNEEHHHEGNPAIGEGKAIVKSDERLGFQLSMEAIQSLKLHLKNVNEHNIKIDKNTLVIAKDKKGVYRYRDHYFKLVPVSIIKQIDDHYLVEINEIQFGDQIVVNGVGLLRVADIFSTDTSEYGHSH